MGIPPIEARVDLAGYQGDFAGMCGASPRMQKIYHTVARLAQTRDPVLVLGESGSGKELVARALHAQGPWSDRPFVPIDCGALTPTLIESEIFGHVRGAFTGATESRQGLLAAAGEGTVFLDEIVELPIELQPKLLRVLQEREIRPLGSNQRIPMKARIIAATDQDLAAAIKGGTFRKELYFRLNVVSIKLPPLRERREDIPGLVRFFLAKHKASQAGITDVSDEAMARLMSYDWPGNVRELENCIQRVLALGSAPKARVVDLPSTILYFVGQPAPEQPAVATLRELEQRQILQALEATKGDRQRAAKLLGIGKTTIYRKIKEYGLEDAVNPQAGD
ncbi:MAG: sigma-54 dependent transcriptional regulator [Terriglobia bacterium]|jgi:two-component system response regulator HydG